MGWQGPCCRSCLNYLHSLERLVREFSTQPDLTNRRTLAREIVQGVTGETDFFEWESAPQRAWNHRSSHPFETAG